MTYFWPFILFAVTAVTPVNMPSGLCVGVPFEDAQPVEPLLDALDTDCFLDWHYASSGDGYVPMLYSDESGGIYTLMRRQPDRLWLVLNEPERPDQADVTPDEAIGITAQVAQTGVPWACCGTIAWDYAWLDAYLDGGGIVPDYWHIHIYGVESPQAWQRQLDGFYTWMDGRGVTRPVIVSETNAGGAGVDAQRALLEHVRTATAEDDRLVAVFWFATRYRTAGTAALFDSADGLTPVGVGFRELTD